MKSGNKATTEKTVQVTTLVTSNGTANIATYPKLKSDLVQQNWDNIANHYQKKTLQHILIQQERKRILLFETQIQEQH